MRRQRWLIALGLASMMLANTAWAQDASPPSARQIWARDGLPLAWVCYAASDADAPTMTVHVEPLPPFAVARGPDAALIWTMGFGSYPYDGVAAKFTSEDPRFADLLIDSDLGIARLPDGAQISFGSLAMSEESGICRQAFQSDAAQYESAARRARDVGAAPRQPGFLVGPSWPFGLDRFIGLMWPEGQDDRTLIVTFSADASEPTRVEADVPLFLESIRMSASMHGEPFFLWALGRQKDGSIIQVDFRIRSPSEYPAPDADPP